MSGLVTLLEARNLVPSLAGHEADTVAGELAAASGLAIYPRSIAARDQGVYFFARRGTEKLLCVLSRAAPIAFHGEVVNCRQGCLRMCPTDHANAVALRETLPFTAPQPIGVHLSIGMGDRLGLATPGHIRAVRGTGLAPILAQQSIREMTRTQRSAEQVMDDATWGVFEEGFRDGFGADADHLKTTEDIDRTFAAGFRMFTVDPGQYVDNAVASDTPQTLRRKLHKLPWEDLGIKEDACLAMFAGRKFRVGFDLELEFTEDIALKAVVKYGGALAHTVRMNRRLARVAASRPFELEMSVDETDTPTTVHEHFYIAHELQRLAVKVVSLAPRFVGDFEKGIDYKGDLAAFERDFVQHVKIARQFGPYKISIHSGSDKFSIYPIAARHARELVHLKTAGTSYLEAVRAVAEVDPALFREILDFAFERYDEDKASYHVSANVAAVPRPAALKDRALAGVLDSNDGRQLLHVTFGSVLTAKDAAGAWRFRDRLLRTLRANEDVHYEIVARHMRRHIEPFAAAR